jgi:hypothetical protein
MINDNTVQKVPWTKSTVKDTDVYRAATGGGSTTMQDLGNPWFYGNPHRSNLK